MSVNLILRTDSYKFTHWKQYPPGTQRVYSYFESRGGNWHDVVFFGLQYYLKRYLDGAVINPRMIDEAQQLVDRHFGRPGLSNRAGWEHVVGVHGGRLPVVIRAVPEGTVVPGHNVLMTIENTDPACYWLPNYLETLLVQVWYGFTVATQSREMKSLPAEVPAGTGRSEPGRISSSMISGSAASAASRRPAWAAAHLVSFPRHGHVRGHHGRPRLLRRADGRLLDSRRRAFHDHRLGPGARGRRRCGTCSRSSRGPGGRGERQFRHFRGLRKIWGESLREQVLHARRAAW